jgi:hypothetical protein
MLYWLFRVLISLVQLNKIDTVRYVFIQLGHYVRRF